MPRITQECVARIKNATDIVELVGRFIQLRRSGNAWKACCPFHSEKTPSFSVNPARQSFHCFGCGVGGDAVKFLMMFENLDYPTALRRLADYSGIPVVEEQENPEAERRRRLRGRIIEANQLACEYYHRQLCRNRAAGHARDYLARRGFNIDIARAWQLGWAPPDFREFAQLARARHMDDKLLADAYLLGSGQRGRYPVFRDRLMFPIHNVRGEIVGFSGRVLEGDTDPRKYVNTAETAAFRKGELLFGLYKATRPISAAGMTVVVCEGQLDVIACHEKADVRNAVAGLGTAFTDEHAAMLRKYAKRAILCYDGDNAGVKASEKTYRKLAQAGLEVSYAILPPGEDPDSLIVHQGVDALRRALEEARPYLEARADREMELARDDANARAALPPRMADLAAEIPDPIRRGFAVADLATRLNVGQENLLFAVETLISARKTAPPSGSAPVEPEDEDAWENPDGAEPAQGDPAREAHRANAVAIRLHPCIRSLVEFAATNAQAQQILVERIEELQDPIQTLDGGSVLQRILERLPAPGDDDAWRDFTASLAPEQAAALRDLSHAPVDLGDAAPFVDQACERAARETVLARIDWLRAQSRNPALSEEEINAATQESMDLLKMLNG